MVSKKKHKKSPEKPIQHEDIYLDDLQVEIKQEEELIIEDADQQHVQWRFIGIDDDDGDEEMVEWEAEEFQQSCFQQQLESVYLVKPCNNRSSDEIIEISDEDDDNCEEKAEALVSGGNGAEIPNTNELLQVSFIAANSKPAFQTNGTATDAYNTNSINHNTAKADCDFKINPLPFNGEKIVDNVDSFNVGTFHEWMYRKLIKMACHICGVTFKYSVYTYMTHMRQLHPKLLRDISTKYKPHSENVVVCKLCKMHVTPKFNHTLHYLTRHVEPKPMIFLCTFCDNKDFSLANMQKHQIEKHPEVIDKREKCPRCGETFKDGTALEYHFMSVHTREFNSKYVYKCHLCNEAQLEIGKNKFYSHLIEKHKLTNWKVLNFRKMENGSYLSCTKCFKIFVKANVQNLLGHYLTHEEKSSWSCKYCKSHSRFRDWPLPHLCEPMRTYYELKTRDENVIGNDKPNVSHMVMDEERPVSWDEFEAYIEHICPFCNRGFFKFENWRCHVREMHQIHTLHGLNMTVLPCENEKLMCLQCNAYVQKTALELHNHRFQHLPYKPYKCRHCAKCLATYRTALNHAQKYCQDNCKDVRSIACINDNVTPPQESAANLVSILCPFCNNKRFSDFTQISKHFSNVHDNFDKIFTKASKDRSRACKICSMDMKRDRLNELIAHYLQHLNDRPFKCQKCSRSYPIYKNAIKHVQTYHADYISVDVNKHLKTFIKDEPETKPLLNNTTIFKEETETTLLPLPIKKDLTPNSLPHRTTDCPPSERLPSTHPLKTLRPHQKSIIPLKTLEENGITQSLSFKTKSKCGLNLGDFNSSVFKTFEKYITYVCPECNKNFSKYFELENHIKAEHTFYQGDNLRFIASSGKGRVKCLDCLADIVLCASKQQNHKLGHMPYRPFVCAICSTHFTTVAGLYKHFRGIHFNQGSYKCHLCSRVFKLDFERLQHAKNFHSKQKCPDNVCKQCFKVIKDMESHLVLHHSAHVRTHRCRSCGAYFEYPKELESHMEKVHLKGISTSRATNKRKLRSLSSDDNAKKVRSSPASPLKSNHR